MKFFNEGFDLDLVATEEEYFKAVYALAAIRNLITSGEISDYSPEEKEQRLVELGENVVIINSFMLSLSFEQSLLFAQYTQYFIESLIDEKTKTIDDLEKLFNSQQ